MVAALRKAGKRITRQREAILKVLTKSDDHPNAVKVHRRSLRIDKTVSLATVYRTLSVLKDQGVIHQHLFKIGASRFETSDTPHHDHLIDVETGKVLEFSSDRIEQLQTQIAAEMGYKLISHRLELYCRKSKPSSKKTQSHRS